MQKTYRDLLDAAGRAKTKKTSRRNHRFAAEAFNRDHDPGSPGQVVQTTNSELPLIGPAETREDGLASVPVLEGGVLVWLGLDYVRGVRRASTEGPTIIPTDAGAEPDEPTRGRVAAESRAGDEGLVDVEPVEAEDAARQIADGVRDRIGESFDDTYDTRSMGERLWTELYGHGAWLDLQESESGRGRPSRREIEQAIDLLSAPLDRGETDEDAIRRAIDLLRSETDPGPVGKIEIERALDCSMGFELPDSLASAIEEELGDYVLFRESDLDRAGEMLHETREERARAADEVAEELAGVREEWEGAAERANALLEQEGVEAHLDPRRLSIDDLIAVINTLRGWRASVARALGLAESASWKEIIEIAGETSDSISASAAGRVAARTLGCECSPLAVEAALESRLYDTNSPVERPAPTRDATVIEDWDDAVGVLTEHARRLVALERAVVTRGVGLDPADLVELDELRDLVQRVAGLLGCDPTPEQARLSIESLHEGRAQLERALLQMDVEAKQARDQIEREHAAMLEIDAERTRLRSRLEDVRRDWDEAATRANAVLHEAGVPNRLAVNTIEPNAIAAAIDGAMSRVPGAQLVEGAETDAEALDHAAGELERARQAALALARRAVGEACVRACRTLAQSLEDHVEIGAIALGRRHVAEVES